MKPFMGNLQNWTFVKCDPQYGLGYYVVAVFDGHPRFHGRKGHTSWVEKFYLETMTIETRNSTYQLVGEGEIPVDLVSRIVT
jgi:hypothetical protein